MFNKRYGNWRILAAAWALPGCVTIGVFAQQPATATAPSSPPYKVVVDPSTATVYTAEKPVLRYRYAEVPFKPYVDLFYTPAGVNILRDSPSDHKHHHGIMFAVAVDGLDFWAEPQGAPSQVHQVLNEVRVGQGAGVSYGGFVDGDLAWVDRRSNTPVLFEDRRIEVVRMKNQKASLFTWESGLSLPDDKKTATLSGSEYFGLGMRFVKSMDTGGKFVNSDGKTGVQGTNAAKAKWCAYSANAGGKPVTVAIFDHPGNLRQPAAWFTMETPFAYLAVTLNLKNEPLVLQADRPLLLRYGVALWDGQVDAKEIDDLYRRWVGLFQAPPPGPGGSQPPVREPVPPPPAQK